MAEYQIRQLCHRQDMTMGCHGFAIDLSPDWQTAVAQCELDQNKIDQLIMSRGRAWLDAAGFDAMYDPDNCGFHRDPAKKLGPNSCHLYQPYSIRIAWGKWGPEHISVPGNACGLDIDRNSYSLFKNGASLLPHNIDSLNQKYLLLMVFTEIAEDLIIFKNSGD